MIRKIGRKEVMDHRTLEVGQNAHTIDCFATAFAMKKIVCCQSCTEHMKPLALFLALHARFIGMQENCAEQKGFDRLFVPGQFLMEIAGPVEQGAFGDHTTTQILQSLAQTLGRKRMIEH